MKHIPRFFVEADLQAGTNIVLSYENMRHAAVVLRLKDGDTVRVFNQQYGEWNCTIADVKKRIIKCCSMLRNSKQETGPILACALINPNRFSILLEKVTELGVSEIVPIITRYTQYKNFNRKKSEQIIIQASEQSRRLSIPKLRDIVYIEDFLENYDYQCEILVGDERLQGNKLKDVLKEKCVFFVGPEGGFSDYEYNLFEKFNFVRTFYFCQNILRSETAAIAFISAWQTCCF